MADDQAHILVVEDDESISEAIAFHLARAGMRVTTALDGDDGLRALRGGPPDAMVLDLMLPNVDGWHIIRDVREWAPQLPILVVSARTSEDDRVEALRLGADDVIGKPFSMRELVARVAAALRRSAVAQAGPRAPIVEGELAIDPQRLSVTVAGRPVALTPLEWKLLWVLAESAARVLTRDVIFQRVWGGERGHGDRSVDVLVRRLRRKIDETAGAFTYVQTQHGVGYRFEATPRAMPGERRPAEAPAVGARGDAGGVRPLGGWVAARP